MTAVEIIVTIGAAVLGFWIVSYLMDEMKRPDNPVKRPPAPVAGALPQQEGWAQTLGVAETAGKEEIAAAYQQKISEYHPDKLASLGPELRAMAESRARLIDAAYAEAMKLHGMPIA
ncbi:MAG TPA: DnaJ domain-containing protein [Gallionellaceae bacterium]|nr:DnaJ domain-containing protein [Gallionellaceae bacterium]